MTCRAAVDQEQVRLGRLVAQGGGVWVGVQRCPRGEDLLLFDDPASGTTLSLPVSQVTAEAVGLKIQESRTRRHPA